MLKRNSNIELLRILSMIMIILGHCNIYGNYDITNMNQFFNKFVIGNTYLSRKFRSNYFCPYNRIFYDSKGNKN